MIKWIGQHIWDFVSRFRNDVYLENIADGTVDSDKFLGLDSNNKIVKEAVSGGTTISNDANDRVTTAMGNGNLNAEANLTWNNTQLGLEYSGADGPTILLTKTGDNATAPIINFVAQRAASGGAANNDDDYLGYTRYWGYNNAGTPEAIKFAEIQSQISERDDGVEEGRLDLLVQARGALRTGFSCVGNGSAIVDTTIGTGATSVATITGDAYVTSNIQLGHASDTTLARSAAGKVTIEGNEIQTTNVHHHFLNAGFFLNYPYSRYIPLNGSISEQNTSTASPEYTHFIFPYDGYVKTIWLRSETSMGSTELKLYGGTAGNEVTTAKGAVTATVAATGTTEFDFTSVTNTFVQGESMAVRVDPTDDPDGGQNVTVELVFNLTT